MKTAYQVSVISEGINVSRDSYYVVVATNVAAASKAALKHVRSLTREKVRVVLVTEVFGESIIR